MSSLFPFFFLFAAAATYLWLLGSAFVSPSRNWSENALRAPWIGWAILLGALQVTHLFAPINRPTAAGLLIACGGAAVIVIWLRWRARRPQTVNRIQANNLLLFGALGVASLLAFFPVFNACTKAMILYDLGLYYLKAVRWIATYPIVPGLANVQGHLGFNQPGFLITTLFDALLPERWGIFLIGGILPWLGLASSLFALFCLGLHAAGKLGSPRPITVAYACSLPVWVYAFLYENLSSGSPNLILACVMIHLFLVFASFLSSPDEQERKSWRALGNRRRLPLPEVDQSGACAHYLGNRRGVTIRPETASPLTDGASARSRNLRGPALRVGLSGRPPFRLPVFPLEFSRGACGLARARFCDESLSGLYSALVALSARRRSHGPAGSLDGFPTGWHA